MSTALMDVRKLPTKGTGLENGWHSVYVEIVLWPELG